MRCSILTEGRSECLLPTGMTGLAYANDLVASQRRHVAAKMVNEPPSTLLLDGALQQPLVTVLGFPWRTLSLSHKMNLLEQALTIPPTTLTSYRRVDHIDTSGVSCQRSLHSNVRRYSSITREYSMVEESRIWSNADKTVFDCVKEMSAKVCCWSIAALSPARRLQDEGTYKATQLQYSRQPCHGLRTS